MCGIQGFSTPEADSGLCGNFLSANFIKERGPDDAGQWSNAFAGNHIFLHHSRLSVIDTSVHASQPMIDDLSDWVITYNGEIYNYLELRDELISLGWKFGSESDTEVLLKAWSQWGLDALPKLNGMFAFAVVHRVTGEMWLLRDRFGVKPLLWARTPRGGVVFSSSVAAVADAIGASVNTEYCSFGLRYKAFELPEGATAFKGVSSLKPGGWLRITVSSSNITLQEGQWYDLRSAVNNKLVSLLGASDDELLAQCQYLLNDAVRIRLRSDVSLAVSLSGGLDSSSIAATASGMMKNLHGFTYGAANAIESEGPTVARFAKELGLTPHFIWPQLDSSGLDSLLERTLECQEAPFPSLSVMAQNEVFRVVRESGFKVLLGGQGGDEIFAGYRKFFVVAVRHALHKREISEATRLLYSLGLMLIHEAGSARLYWNALSRYSNKPDTCFSLMDWQASGANLWGAVGGTMADRQIQDVQRWSIPTLLRYEDRNSMGHGVESRLPFMDYRLVELALALPTRLKLSNGFGKWAVREITEGVVPDFVRLNRKKRGFDVTQSWISNGLGASLRARINDNMSVLSPYLKSSVDVNRALSDAALQTNCNLLDEALMLAWLVKPVRPRIGMEIFV